jgi:hypothetical protein
MRGLEAQADAPAQRIHLPDARDAAGAAAAKQDPLAVGEPSRLAGCLTGIGGREPPYVVAVRRHPGDLEVALLAGLADRVGDVGARRRPVGLAIELGTGRQPPLIGSVGVHGEDVAAAIEPQARVGAEARERDPPVEDVRAGRRWAGRGGGEGPPPGLRGNGC